MVAFNKRVVVKAPARDCEEDICKKIEQKAYELWEKRGCSHGNDWADWLDAEKIVKGRR